MNLVYTTQVERYPRTTKITYDRRSGRPGNKFKYNLVQDKYVIHTGL